VGFEVLSLRYYINFYLEQGGRERRLGSYDQSLCEILRCNLFCEGPQAKFDISEAPKRVFSCVVSPNFYGSSSDVGWNSIIFLIRSQSRPQIISRWLNGRFRAYSALDSLKEGGIELPL
jgi:hypothetical protein